VQNIEKLQQSICDSDTVVALSLIVIGYYLYILDKKLAITTINFNL